MPIYEDDEDNESEDLSKVQSELSALKSNKEINQSMLAAVMALADAVEDIKESRKDNTLSQSIEGSITKLSEAIIAMAKEQRIDITPFAKANEKSIQSVQVIMLDLKAQNKELIGVISDLVNDDKKEDVKHETLLKALLSNIKAMNVNLENSVEKVDYRQELKDIVTGLSRPLMWEHRIYYKPGGKMDMIESKAVKQK